MYIIAALCRVTSFAKHRKKFLLKKLLASLKNSCDMSEKTKNDKCRKTSTAEHKPLDTLPKVGTSFYQGFGAESQVRSLEARCFWHVFSSTPDAIPNLFKCAGNSKWMRLQALRRGLVNFRRDGSSAKLLWLGTRPNHDKSRSWNSSCTNVSVNNFATLVAPTPCIYADLAASLSM